MDSPGGPRYWFVEGTNNDRSDPIWHSSIMPSTMRGGYLFQDDATVPPPDWKAPDAGQQYRRWCEANRWVHEVRCKCGAYHVIRDDTLDRRIADAVEAGRDYIYAPGRGA